MEFACGCASDLFITNPEEFSSKVFNDVTINDTLDVGGVATFDNNVQMNADARVEGSLHVVGDITHEGDMEVTGHIKSTMSFVEAATVVKGPQVEATGNAADAFFSGDGGLTLDSGNILLTTGSLTITSGSITAGGIITGDKFVADSTAADAFKTTSGGLEVGGLITSSSDADPALSLTGLGGIAVTAGGITVTSGDITASTGKLVSGSGATDAITSASGGVDVGGPILTSSSATTAIRTSGTPTNAFRAESGNVVVVAGNITDVAGNVGTLNGLIYGTTGQFSQYAEYSEQTADPTGTTPGRLFFKDDAHGATPGFQYREDGSTVRTVAYVAQIPTGEKVTSFTLDPLIDGVAISGLSTTNAEYVKIGDLVIFRFFFQWTGDESANAADFTFELPFTSDQQSNTGDLLSQNIDPGANFLTWGFLVVAPSTTAKIRIYNRTGAAPGNLNGTHTSSAGTKYIGGMLTYHLP